MGICGIWLETENTKKKERKTNNQAKIKREKEQNQRANKQKHE